MNSRVEIILLKPDIRYGLWRLEGYTGQGIPSSAMAVMDVRMVMLSGSFSKTDKFFVSR